MRPLFSWLINASAVYLVWIGPDNSVSIFFKRGTHLFCTTAKGESLLENFLTAGEATEGLTLQDTIMLAWGRNVRLPEEVEQLCSAIQK